LAPRRPLRAAEQLHAPREAVLKEEVNVGKRKMHDTQTVAGMVCKEERKIEETGDVKDHGDVKGTTPSRK
jgi:uncharacterized protein (TIGR02271 family)